MSRHVAGEAGILLRHPLGLLACGFGSALSPWASGTTGSAVAAALFWLCEFMHITQPPTGGTGLPSREAIRAEANLPAILLCDGSLAICLSATPA